MNENVGMLKSEDNLRCPCLPSMFETNSIFPLCVLHQAACKLPAILLSLPSISLGALVLL